MHTKSELAFLRGILSGKTKEEAQRDMSRIGLPPLCAQNEALWENFYIPILQDYKTFVASVTKGNLSMTDVLAQIQRRRKGEINE